MSMSVGLYNPFADVAENSALRSNVAPIRRQMYEHEATTHRNAETVILPPHVPILNANVEHNAPLSSFSVTAERGPAYRGNDYNPSRYVESSTVLLSGIDDTLDRTHTLTTSVLEEMADDGENEVGPSAIDYAMAERERTQERRLAKINRVREFNRNVAVRVQKAQEARKLKEAERQKALRRVEERVMEAYRSSVRSMAQSVTHGADVDADADADAANRGQGRPLDDEVDVDTGVEGDNTDDEAQAGGIEMVMEEAVVQVDRRPNGSAGPVRANAAATTTTHPLQRSSIGRIDETEEEGPTEAAAALWPTSPVRRSVQKKTTESAWARSALLSHKTRNLDANVGHLSDPAVPGASAGLRISMHHTKNDDGQDQAQSSLPPMPKRGSKSAPASKPLDADTLRLPGSSLTSGSVAPSVTSLVVHAGSESAHDQDIDDDDVEIVSVSDSDGSGIDLATGLALSAQAGEVDEWEGTGVEHVDVRRSMGPGQGQGPGQDQDLRQSPNTRERLRMRQDGVRAAWTDELALDRSLAGYPYSAREAELQARADARALARAEAEAGIGVGVGHRDGGGIEAEIDGGDADLDLGPAEARRLRALIRDSEMALERTRIRAQVLLKEEKKRERIEQQRQRAAEKRRAEEEARLATLQAAEERRERAQKEMQRLRDLKTAQRETMREAATGKVMERYIEALRFQLMKKIEKNGARIPALCGCGIDPLDADGVHSTNCVYRAHPDQYVKALSDVLHSKRIL